MSTARQLWLYQCEWDGCSKRFTRLSTFDAHYRKHTDHRPHACDYGPCGETFHDRGPLVRHQRTHADERPFACKYESYNQAFDNSGASDQDSNKPVQIHRHDREGREMNSNSVKEIRPIRLRLSQPKRPNVESLEGNPRKRLLIRLPMQKTQGELFTSDPSNELCPESRSSVRSPTKNNGKRNPHSDVHLLQPNLGNISTSETGAKCHVFGHDSSHRLPAVPHISTLRVRSETSALQPAVNSRSAERTSHEACAKIPSVYTEFCGVYSTEKTSPKRASTGGGRYHCPRCDTCFSKSYYVRRHFMRCITAFGNPDSLRWTDHVSLQDTVRFYARHGHQGQKYDLVPSAAEVKASSKGEHPKDPLFLFLVPRTSPSAVEKKIGDVEPVTKLPSREALLQAEIVRSTVNRRDALRCSNYNSETIARDVLLATGSHPYMDPLNAHLDVLRKRFLFVNLDSNMSTFRWDLVDPEQGPPKEPDREPGSKREYGSKRQDKPKVKPEQSARNACKAKKHTMKSKVSDVQWRSDSPFSLQSGPSTKPAELNSEVAFKVILPDETHFGAMSTIFSSVFNHDPSAKLMSSHEELWAVIFTMLESGYRKSNFRIRAAIRKQTGEVIGWAACHEVDIVHARPEDQSAYLDWMTAAHLLPPQISRFTSVKESAKQKAECLNQRKVGRSLASTIQARATEAQTRLIPIHRLVVNALVVHPLHQGRGIASTLLESITEIMDVEKRPIWVQAPEDPAIAQGKLKAGLFRRAGFMCAGQLNLDLDPYASKSRQRDKGKGVSFGTYTWNYMLRWPQPVSQESS